MWDLFLFIYLFYWFPFNYLTTILSVSLCFKKRQLYNYGSKAITYRKCLDVFPLPFSGFSPTELTLQVKWENSSAHLLARSHLCIRQVLVPAVRAGLITAFSLTSFWRYDALSFLSPLSLLIAFLNHFPLMYLLAFEGSCIHDLPLV